MVFDFLKKISIRWFWELFEKLLEYHFFNIVNFKEIKIFYKRVF